MAVYNKRHYPLIFNIILALHLKQSKCQTVLEHLTNGTNHPSTDNNDASNIVQPSWSGKLDIEPLINEEIAAAKLNRSATLLKAFTKHSVHKSITIYSLGDNTY